MHFILCFVSPTKWPLSRSQRITCNLPESCGSPCGSAGKESAAMRGTWVQSLSWEDLLEKGKARSPREGKGYPFQYSGQENSRDCILHGVTKSRTRLSDVHCQSLAVDHSLLVQASCSLDPTVSLCFLFTSPSIFLSSVGLFFVPSPEIGIAKVEPLPLSWVYILA